jgi:hypothetical protein
MPQTQNTISAETIDELISGKCTVKPTIKNILKEWGEYKERLSKQSDNDNNCLGLSTVMLRLYDYYTNRKTFNVNDFVLLAAHMDLDNEVVINFFADMMQYLVESKFCEIIRAEDSVYNFNSYYFI